MKKLMLIAAGTLLTVAVANAQVTDSTGVRTQEEETAGQMNRQRPEGQNTDMYKRTNPVDSAYRNQNKTSDPTRPYQSIPQNDQGYGADTSGHSTGSQYRLPRNTTGSGTVPSGTSGADNAAPSGPQPLPPTNDPNKN
jgi:hypothetical protein